jgi:hypothetical protein
MTDDEFDERTESSGLVTRRAGASPSWYALMRIDTIGHEWAGGYFAPSQVARRRQRDIK